MVFVLITMRHGLEWCSIGDIKYFYRLWVLPKLKSPLFYVERAGVRNQKDTATFFRLLLLIINFLPKCNDTV